MKSTNHRLPTSSEEPPSPETQWYIVYNKFEQQETNRQIEFKQKYWPSLEDGPLVNSNSYYPHILPAEYAFKNVFPRIKTKLKEYLDKNKISIHAQFSNMRSSQACCFNFLFPLRDVPVAAEQFLSPVLPGVQLIMEIEFEDTGIDGTTEWLGEPPGGKRGQNRTSADASIQWIDKQGKRRLTYIEWKYTEKKFGNCGGYNSPANTTKNKCRKLVISKQLSKCESQCYLASNGNNRCSRIYWERILASSKDKTGPILLEKLNKSEGCPFIGPLYQLMRLELLAEHSRLKNDQVDIVDVAVIHFEKNESLFKPPKHLKYFGSDVGLIWKSALREPDNFRWVSVEKMMEAYDKSPMENMWDWREYLRKRYGV